MVDHQPELFIGLMSGTSMDSIDAVLVDFSCQPPQLIDSLNRDITDELKQNLLKLCELYRNDHDYDKNSDTQILSTKMDEVLAQEFSGAVNQLIRSNKLKPSEICAVGSHGQTIFHQPPHIDSSSKKINGYSVQIGNPSNIAKLTQIKTIADFRNADMRVGGQGAPLVPAFHQTVFSHPEKNRIIINIGGIANITLLPRTDANNNSVSGFDTGPGNVLMDYWVKLQCNKDYDADGSWAASGEINSPLLHLLLEEEPYFQQPSPKSTGRELFNSLWLEEKFLQFSVQHNANLSDVDIQATLCSLTAISISQEIKRTMPEVDEVFVCGGGTFNRHLMTTLQNTLQKENSNLVLGSTEELGILPDWVEAIAFAWLAKQRVDNKPSNLPVVTGAREAVLLGEIFSP